jgi:type I restriction enzyme, S subunit
MAASRPDTRTGGRPASTGVIPGDLALSVGRPEKPAPSGWRWIALSDVARLETGHTPSRRHPEYWGGDVPWVGIKDATENHGRVINDTLQHTNELGIANSSARVLPANTVCLSRTASVGYVVVMGRPMATSQDFVNWVCSEALHHRFLKYVLLAERSAFLRFASGTTHQTIYFPEVKAFHVCLPPLSEQRAIAHILGTLDDKIELNRRMNETLEAMARALFKSWFVDFDPVRANTEGRDPSLPKQIADLFPDSFAHSELGEIPEGWTIGTLADFALLNPESWSRDTRPVVINYVDLSNTKWGRIESVRVHAGNDTPSRAQRILRLRDTIVGMVRPGNGSYAFISEEGLTGSTGFAVLRPRRAEYAEFVYLVATAAENIEALHHLADGGAYPAVRPEVVAATRAIKPSDEVIEQFSCVVGPLVARMAENERESGTLAALRDTLLPKLISGELRVGHAERVVEEAL